MVKKEEDAMYLLLETISKDVREIRKENLTQTTDIAIMKGRMIEIVKNNEELKGDVKKNTSFRHIVGGGLLAAGGVLGLFAKKIISLLGLST